MRILNIKTIFGPNVYHQMPVLVMRLDLEEWTNIASNQVEGFNERLTALLPGLDQHACSLGHAGGFIKRLEAGTYAAHIVEHCALELSRLSGMDVSYGKSRFAGQQGIYDVVTRFQSEEGMEECLRSAVELVLCIYQGQSFDVEGHIKYIQDVVRRYKLGPSAQTILDAASRRSIPYKKIGDESLFLLGYGCRQRRVQSAITSKTSLIASDLVQDKFLTKQLLEDCHIPVPQGVTVRSEEDLEGAIQGLKGPFVLKPVDGHHGEGVCLNLSGLEELKCALGNAKQFSTRFLVEEMKPGKDYRILLIGQRFVAAAERTPPTVKGDGQSSIAQLIEKLNQDPLRGEGHESLLTRIEVDPVLEIHLAKQGLQLSSVIESGRQVILRANANLSSGGTATDRTKDVHPEVVQLCERISRIVDLDICGIDIIAEDISHPVQAETFSVIEVNTGPGLRMHLRNENKEAIGDRIMEELFPTGESRIPIYSVTGTNGKTTVVRLLRHILRQRYPQVGMTSTDGVWLGEHKIVNGDCSGPLSAELILHDPKTECAVLEVARGGLLRGGLPYDWSDVGIITNIQADHIGQDGIEDIDDLVWIKSLVAERVKKNGVIVLNADDENCVTLPFRRIQKHPRRLCYFSVHENNEILNEHIRQGGWGFWKEGDSLMMAVEGQIRTLISFAEIPLTMEGKAEFQVSNVLAAAAAVLASGIAEEECLWGLRSFEAASSNPGRMNIYEVREGYVILDYGHNAEAIANVGQIVSAWNFSKKSLVVGLPGDRRTDLIEQAGELIPLYYDNVILRDDSDLRGRQPGEVPFILKSIFDEKFPNLSWRINLDEEAAVFDALSKIQKNEIVVVLFEKFESALKALREFDPVPIKNLPPLESQPRPSLYRPTEVHGDLS